MKKSELIQLNMDRLQAEYLATLEAEQAAIEKYGAEPTTEGAVIAFRAQFAKGGTRYRYAAIRVNGRWFTTGPNSPKSYTWHELTTWLDGMHRVSKIKVLRPTDRFERPAYRTLGDIKDEIQRMADDGMARGSVVYALDIVFGDDGE